jgi:iron(III) transport system permease protein
MSLAIFQNILRAEYYSAAAMSVVLVALVLILQGIANLIGKKQRL